MWHLVLASRLEGKVMTEAEWLNDRDAHRMLGYLFTRRVRTRKWRLVECAFLRFSWAFLTDDRSRQAVEVAERDIDQPLNESDLQLVRTEASEAWEAIFEERYADQETRAETGRALAARWAAQALSRGPRVRRIQNGEKMSFLQFLVPLIMQDQEDPVTAGISEEIRSRITAAQADVLHDLFGNPFRPRPSVKPLWLRWNDGTVARLAQAAYEERILPAGTLDNGRLAILADALEEAGCSNVEILGHLRGSGPHVRGCYVLDLLLARRQGEAK
jgi:hypothetical protein